MRKEAAKQEIDNGSMKVALEAFGKSVARWTENGEQPITAVPVLAYDEINAHTAIEVCLGEYPVVRGDNLFAFGFKIKCFQYDNKVKKYWHGICSTYQVRSTKTILKKKESQMKKVLSTIVAALVAVSFAGAVFAAEPAAPAAAAPAVEKAAPAEKAPVKKHKKHKKAKKAKKAEKKEEAPAAAPAAPAAK